MQTIRGLLGALALVLILGLQGFPLLAQPTVQQQTYPIMQVREPADWTIFAYYGGDNDLEPHILNDANEFELAGGSNDTVRIIMLLDRSPGGYSSPENDWSGARIYDIKPDRTGDHLTIYPPTLDSLPLANLGEVDTGSAETLTEFLTWGVTHFPADRYAVAFGSHGAGWRGVVTDDSSESILTLDELNSAMSAATEAASVDKFDLLINDACLMSSVEYYSMISQYFEYSIGSAELIVSPAMDMTRLVQILRSEPQIELNLLGRRLVDEYVTVIAPEKFKSLSTYLTGSLTDLAPFPDLAAAVENFAAVVNTDPKAYARLLGRVRAQSYTYTTFANGSTDIDIGDFMRKVIAGSNDETLKAAAQQVLDTLESTLVYGNAGAVALSAVQHYNIYFPERASDFAENYISASGMPQWGQMLQNYYTALIPDAAGVSGFHVLGEPQVTITGIYPEIATFEDGAQISIDVAGRNVARGSYSVDQIGADGVHTRIATRPLLAYVPNITGDYYQKENRWTQGIDSRSIGWSATGYMLKTAPGAEGNFEFVTQASDGKEAYFLEARFRLPGTENWVDVTVTFANDVSLAADLRYETATNRNADSGAIAVVPIPEGSEFQVYRTVVGADGTLTREPGNTYIWPADGMVMDEEALPAGDYDFSVKIESYGGGATSTSKTITVASTDAAESLRAHNWSRDFGFILRAPQAFNSELRVFSGYLELPINRAFATETLPASLSVLAYYFRNASPAYETDTRLILHALNAPAGLELAPTSIGGHDALEFSFEGGPRNVPWKNRGFSIHDEERQLTLVFLISDRDPESAPEIVDNFYALIRDNIEFVPFDAGDSVWATGGVSPLETFPVPRGWERSDRAGWVNYVPEDLRQTFAAFTTVALTEGQTTSDALNEIYAALAQAEEISRESYDNGNLTWEAITYSRSRGRQTGRLYAASVGSTAYIARFETVATEAEILFPEVFENMIDAFTIVPAAVNERFEGFGVEFARPNPILTVASVNLYEASQDKVFYRINHATQLVEMFLVPQSDGDLNTIAQAVTRAGLEIVGDSVEIEVKGRAGLEVTVTRTEENGDVWNGKYFASYDEEKQLGTVIGARSVEEFADYAQIYADLISSIVFIEGSFNEYTNIENKATNFSPINEYGFRMQAPLAWQPIIHDRGFSENINRIAMVGNPRYLYVYVVFNQANDLEAITRLVAERRGWTLDESSLTETTVNGKPAVEFIYTTERFEGKGFTVYDEQREHALVIDAFRATGAPFDYEALFETAKSTLSILPLDE